MKNNMKKIEDVKMTQEEKDLVADLSRQVNAELTPAKVSELSGEAASHEDDGFVDYHEKIDELKLPTKGVSWMNGQTARQIREALHRLVGLTRKVGGKVVRIGRRIVNWIFSVLDRFPRSVGAIVLVVLIGALLGAIPLIGGLVSCLFQIPALYAAGALVFLEAGADLWIAVKRA